MFLLATYPSSHWVLKAEQELRAALVVVELIPAPRQVRSQCGFCLLAEVEDGGARLRASGAESLWRVFEPEPGHYRRTYEPYP